MKRSSIAVRLAVQTAVCFLAASGGASVFAADAEPSESGQSRVEQQKKLEDAQQRLEVAAREVAELSMSLSDGMLGHTMALGLNGQRAILGINIAPRHQAREAGVEVLSVSPGGAAADAGLKAGDVLTEINGLALKGEGDRSAHDKLLAAMREVEPEQKVQIRYQRDGKASTANLIAQRAENRMFMRAMPGIAGRFAVPGPLPHLAFSRAEGVFGSAELVPITPKLGQYFGTDKGLLVVRAPTDSRLKLEEGDVILDIDGRTPSSPSHALRILSSYQGGEKLKLNVLRAKKRQSFEITVPESPFEKRFERQHFSVPPGAEPTGFPGPPAPPPPGGAIVMKLRDNTV